MIIQKKISRQFIRFCLIITFVYCPDSYASLSTKIKRFNHPNTAKQCHKEFLIGFIYGACFPFIGAAFAGSKAHKSRKHLKKFSDHTSDAPANMILQRFYRTCDSTALSSDTKKTFCATYKELRLKLALDPHSFVDTYAQSCDNLLNWPEATQDMHNKILNDLICDSNFFTGITVGSTLSAYMIFIGASTGELKSSLTKLDHMFQSINKKQ